MDAYISDEQRKLCCIIFTIYQLLKEPYIGLGSQSL